MENIEGAKWHKIFSFWLNDALIIYDSRISDFRSDFYVVWFDSRITLEEQIHCTLAYAPKEESLKLLNERPKKVLILGSGGLSIGQAGEFDYCGSQVRSCMLHALCIVFLVLKSYILV